MNRLLLPADSAVQIVLAAALVALCAQFSFPIPGTEIPQTGQTVAVLVCGALLGARLGAAALALYLLAGVVGLPVYSDGGSGWSALTGGSAGYFAGFVLAAAAMGMLHNNLQSRKNALWMLYSLGFMLLGHLIILLGGWLWLSIDAGWSGAYRSGVQPFYYGGLVKSVLATAIIALTWQIPMKWRLRALPKG